MWKSNRATKQTLSVYLDMFLDTKYHISMQI